MRKNKHEYHANTVVSIFTDILAKYIVTGVGNKRAPYFYVFHESSLADKTEIFRFLVESVSGCH